MLSWGLPNAMLFFTSIVLGLVLLVRAWSTRREASEGDQFFRAFLIVVCTVAAVIFLPSVLAVQKWLTALALPPGLLWLGLILLGILLSRYRLRLLAGVAWLMWLLLTLAGNEHVSRRLLHRLEREYARVDPLSVASSHDPFDVVVALGGATRRTPAGQVELAEAGDRVVLAARLFHLGHARMLASMGEPNVELLGPGRHPAEEARIIWRSLGIPRDTLVVLRGGTTAEELELLAEEAGRRGWESIGLITSAWHMQRAMRLAESAGLTAIPLPADFVGDIPEWKQIHVVPTGQALFESSRAMKEYLARLVGR